MAVARGEGIDHQQSADTPDLVREPGSEGSTTGKRPRVVIVGAGFGGIAAARALARVPVDVTIVDRRNYHLFQPLLYQVATADLSPADVAWPIRGMFTQQDNASVFLAKVTGIDKEVKQVMTEQGTLFYDYLVLATGSRHSYFGKDEWAPHAPGLKRIIDATEVRKRILVAFERAEMAIDLDEQRRQLNFVIVGGGPTGVELAGAIAELAHKALAKDFRRIDTRKARIILVQSGDRLLKGFPERLSAYAKQALERLGVEVILQQRVKVHGDQGALLGEELIPAATMIWAAGVEASSAGKWLGAETDRAGRIVVGPNLSVKDHPEIFAIGDTALVMREDGQPVPGIAPAAKQGGKYVAEVIKARVQGGRDPKPFRYRHFGNLATIGRHSAVVDFGWITFKGGVAWWLWGLAHIYFLIGVRSPMIVAMQWFWAYLTFKKGARLITGLTPLFEDIAATQGASHPARDKS